MTLERGTRKGPGLQERAVGNLLDVLNQTGPKAFVNTYSGINIAADCVLAVLADEQHDAQSARSKQNYLPGLENFLLRSDIARLQVDTAIDLIRAEIGPDAPNKYIDFVNHLWLLRAEKDPQANLSEVETLTKEPRFWSALLAHTLAGNIHASKLGDIDEILSKNRPQIPGLDNRIEKLKQVQGLLELLPRFLSKSPAATVVKELIDYSRSNNSVSEVDPLGGRLIEQYNSLEPNSPKRSRLLDLRIEVGKKVAEIKEGHENNLAAFSAELTKLMLSSRLSPLERFLTTELLIETDRRTDTPSNPESAKYIRFAKHIEQLKIENCQREVFEDLQELTKARQFWYALLANSLNTKMQHQTNFEPIDKLLASNKHLHQEDPQAKALLAQLGETPRVRDFFPNLLGAAIAKDLDSDRDDFSVEASDL